MTWKPWQEPGADAAAAQPDAALMGQIADFHKAYAEARAAHDKWVAEQHRVEALPECPPLVEPAFDKEASDRYFAFLKEHGVDDLAHRSTELWRGVGRIIHAVFAAEARTLRGAVEKLKIAQLAHDNEELNAYDEPQGSWLASVMRDLERLAAEGGAV